MRVELALAVHVYWLIELQIWGKLINHGGFQVLIRQTFLITALTSSHGQAIV